MRVPIRLLASSGIYSTIVTGTRALLPKMSAQLLDFDANLLHIDLVGDMERHIVTAQDAGVAYFVVPGSTMRDSEQALALSRQRPASVLATVGIHPFRASEIVYCPDALDALEVLVADDHCLAVGECGLDYSDGFPAREAQLPWFRAHLQLAAKYDLPLYLHIRDAHGDFLRAMDDEKPPASVSVCVHCFTGSTAELAEYCRRGYYISLSGHVIRMQAKSKQPGEAQGSDLAANPVADQACLAEWLRLIPPDRLLIETDAPYMGFKGCRATEVTKKAQNYPNVPASLPLVARAVASAGGIDYEELAARTTANALRFFSFADKKYC